MASSSIPFRSTHGSVGALWPVVVALFLGLVLGGGAVSLTWFVSHHAATVGQVPTTDAGLDATTACADLARVPTSPTTANALARLAGAAILAQAAAAEDTHYRRLATLLNTADLAVQADDTAQSTVALAAARAACAHP